MVCSYPLRFAEEVTGQEEASANVTRHGLPCVLTASVYGVASGSRLAS
jgi:hypothetical protein